MLLFFYEFQIDGDVFVDLFAFCDLLRDLYGDLAHLVRLLRDGSRHVAVLYGFHAVSGAVEADDEDLLACALGRADG